MADGKSGDGERYVLSTGSLTLLRCLTDPSLDQIVWAGPASKILSRIQQLYDIFNAMENTPQRAHALCQKLIELDRYMLIDVEKQIASFNFHVPYYLHKIDRILDRTVGWLMSATKKNSKGVVNLERTKATNEMFDLLWAELEGAFMEYGFCEQIEFLYDIDDVSYKLESMEIATDDLSRDMRSNDRGTTLGTLQHLVARYDGVTQSMSEHAQRMLQNRCNKLSSKIKNVECKMAISLSDTAMNLRSYLNNQMKLNQTIFKAIPYDSFEENINSNTIHPNTRGWVIHKYDQFMRHKYRRILFLTSQEGQGKTTIASSICKLDFTNVIANHFFHGSTNQLAGLVQSIAAGLARTIPEYTHYLQDTFNRTDSFEFLAEPWHTQYDILLRQAMDKLYVKARPSSGRSRAVPADRRSRAIVIDGMERCLQQDYVRTFLVYFLRDFPSWMRLVVTVNSTHLYNVILPDFEDLVETFRIDERPWTGMHIKDIETYMATAISALLQDASENNLFSNRARSDEKTLQNILEELTKYSCGRFDYALELVNGFAEAMEKGGQFLGSIKKAMQPLRQRHGRTFDELLNEFSTAFRSYRDREGRDILVSPVSASHSLHLLSLTRIAKLRNRQTLSAAT